MSQCTTHVEANSSTGTSPPTFTPTARTDLFAAYYGGFEWLPVIGFDPHGNAIVLRRDGRTQRASRRHGFEGIVVR